MLECGCLPGECHCLQLEFECLGYMEKPKEPKPPIDRDSHLDLSLAHGGCGYD
jgi:hypothetical protein